MYVFIAAKSPIVVDGRLHGVRVRPRLTELPTMMGRKPVWAWLADIGLSPKSAQLSREFCRCRCLCPIIHPTLLPSKWFFRFAGPITTVPRKMSLA